MFGGVLFHSRLINLAELMVPSSVRTSGSPCFCSASQLKRFFEKVSGLECGSTAEW